MSSNEKCFCHFNGIQLKDSIARQEIEKLKNNKYTNPELWKLEPGTYLIDTGFYYAPDQYVEIGDGLLTITGSIFWAYFIITKNGKYFGDISSDGETLDGTCQFVSDTREIAKAYTVLEGGTVDMRTLPTGMYIAYNVEGELVFSDVTPSFDILPEFNCIILHNNNTGEGNCGGTIHISYYDSEELECYNHLFVYDNTNGVVNIPHNIKNYIDDVQAVLVQYIDEAIQSIQGTQSVQTMSATSGVSEVINPVSVTSEVEVESGSTTTSSGATLESEE